MLQHNKVETSSNWHIFIVTHRTVPPTHFTVDPCFDRKNFSIIDVSENMSKQDLSLEIVSMNSLPKFESLGAHWAESEAIFNLWKSGVTKDYDYVGFLQYDKELSPIKPRRPEQKNGLPSVTKEIDALIEKAQGTIHISFETHSFLRDYRQRILADFERPEILTGHGKNCYLKVLHDYNSFFEKNVTIFSLFLRRNINLCSCFLVDTRLFDKMMTFFEWVVRHGNLEKLDPNRRHRLQGGLAERYFGVFLMLEDVKTVDLTLPHHRMY